MKLDKIVFLFELKNMVDIIFFFNIVLMFIV